MSRFPSIRQVERIDPQLAQQMREINRMKRVPLAKLKAAAMSYGKDFDEGRGGLFSPAIPGLLATAAAFYKWETRKKAKS